LSHNYAIKIILLDAVTFIMYVVDYDGGDDD